MSKGITIIWVPGAWHGPEHFTHAGQILEGHGYSNVYSSHASVGHVVHDPYEDSNIVIRHVEAELEKGQDVVLVGHSYGGVVITNAAIGLGKKQREAEGKKNGIINLVYLCAFPIPEGATLWNAIGNQPLPWFVMDEEPNYVKSSDEHNVFYNDLSKDVADKLTASLRPHSLNTFHVQIKEETYRKIPSSYLICDLDHAIPKEGQEGLVARAQPEAFQLVEHIEASHTVFVSKVEETAAFVRKAAGEKL